MKESSAQSPPLVGAPATEAGGKSLLALEFIGCTGTGRNVYTEQVPFSSAVINLVRSAGSIDAMHRNIDTEQVPFSFFQCSGQPGERSDSFHCFCQGIQVTCICLHRPLQCLLCSVTGALGAVRRQLLELLLWVALLLLLGLVVLLLLLLLQLWLERYVLMLLLLHAVWEMGLPLLLLLLLLLLEG